jgi:hypothetical protein
VGDIQTLVASLHAYSRGDAMLKELRAELRQPVPAVRRRIKGVALSTLPASGGLNAWVAATKITASVTLTGRRVVVRLRGGRSSVSNLRGGSKGGQSDIRAIDRGRVRHPSWGRRYRGQWFTQTVPEGFFTKTSAEAPEWGPAIDRAAAKALEGIHA